MYFHDMQLQHVSYKTGNYIVITNYTISFNYESYLSVYFFF